MGTESGIGKFLRNANKEGVNLSDIEGLLAGMDKAIGGADKLLNQPKAPPSFVPQQAVSARGLFAQPQQRAPQSPGVGNILQSLGQIAASRGVR